MLIRSLVIGSLALFCIGGSAQAQMLRMGSPAPKLEVKEFLKGPPLKSLDKGKVHVVEFWATWCAPCLDAIPHLTELQKRYRQVNFVGVSIWEDSPADVRPFVARMGAKMDYRVATDLVPAGKSADDGKMSLAWMRAAARSSIPTAFIVDREGRIAWYGHPGAMDEPLARIVAGKWNIPAAAAEMRRNESPEEKLARYNQEIGEARKRGNHRQALALVDQALKEDRRLETALALPRFRALRDLKDPGALPYAQKLVKGTYKDHAKGLDMLAWTLIDPRLGKPAAPSARLALEAAKRADLLSNQRDPSVSDTLARAYFVNGDAKRAMQIQERSLRLGKGTALEKDPLYKEMQARLHEYRKAAK